MRDSPLTDIPDRRRRRRRRRCCFPSLFDGCMAVHQRMPNAGDRTASASRLISRITSPFGQKSRSIADTYIELDEPHKQYSPGDTVTGSVNFRVLKAIKVTHLVVCLHGFVQVYKTPGAPPADSHRAYLGSGRGKKSGEYFGNGFASLFEDEIVLCGDGRLGEGPYQFKFILEFPDRDLPSSIEFERGIVSYMVSATFTRPTTIAPTLQWDRPVSLVERIDISRFYPPKARTITLEPLARRNRARYQARKATDPAVDRRCRKDDSDPNDRRGSQTSSSASARAEGELPRSSTPSELSFESLGSASQQDSNATSARHSDSAKGNGSKVSLTMKTITATVQSLTGGCLRGDTIPIRININHTKYMKSLYGVIITLYRQARVDMHPAIPLGPTEKGKESKYEDYYPKSLTGLGGLSLSGAGSSHVFRKDLAQVMLPLLIDPRTLTAEINGKIRVPEDAFPTISTVPGAMISFRYYIEVVLDIQGKLSNATGSLSNLGGFGGSVNPPQAVEGADLEKAVFNNFGTPIVDTASLRRDKGVVACTFEVIVGTQDSARRKGKKKAERAHSSDASEEAQPNSRRSSPPEHYVQGLPVATPQYEQPNPMTSTEYYYSNDAYSYGRYEDPGPDPGYQQYHQGAGYGYEDYSTVPYPRMPDESQVSEKDRIRQHEARLLPSQPPLEEEDEEQENGEGGLAATAPYLQDEQYHYDPGQSSMSYTRAGPARARDLRSSSDYHDVADEVPAYEAHQHVPVRAMTADSIDRRRGVPYPSFHPPADGPTLAGASAPPLSLVEASAHGATGTGESTESHTHNADSYADVNDSHGEASASLGLPRYEK